MISMYGYTKSIYINTTLHTHIYVYVYIYIHTYSSHIHVILTVTVLDCETLAGYNDCFSIDQVSMCPPSDSSQATLSM